jgi:hypothetical protein
MVAALRKCGKKGEYCVFPQERHIVGEANDAWPWMRSSNNF